MALVPPLAMDDFVVEASPGSMLRISSPRRLFVSPGASPRGDDLEKLTRDAGHLSEDLDELRAKIKGMNVPKLPEQSYLSISTDVSPALSATWGLSQSDGSVLTISDKVDSVKHDLATETRARISRDDEASHRLQKVEQNQHDMELWLQRLHPALQKLEARMEDAEKSLELRCGAEAALRSEAAEAAQRHSASHAELRRAAQDALQRCSEEAQQREQADAAMRLEWQKELSPEVAALRRVEARLGEAQEALAAKAAALAAELRTEHGAREAEVRRLEEKFDGLERKLEKSEADMEHASFRISKDLEDKVSSQKRSVQSELDAKVTEVKDSMAGMAETARMAREALRTEIERERQTREAQMDVQASNMKDAQQARLEPLLSRLSDAQRRFEEWPRAVEEVRAALESQLKDEREAREAALRQSRNRDKDEAQELQQNLSAVKQLLKETQDKLQAEQAASAQELRKDLARSDEKVRELRQELQHRGEDERLRAQKRDEAERVREQLVAQNEERIGQVEAFLRRLKESCR